jgi:ATP-dependent Lhr-like helicase
MSGTSSSFYLLDERIQRFIWAEGWESLRDAQERSIPLLIKADRDVIVAAATAAGKTEAAFFPALTHLLESEEPRLIVYISPLKALINDQIGRLEKLCEQLDIPVWPWHGDVGATSKAKFLKQRHGVLLITPESLEALLCNRGTSIGSVFQRTAYFVIDELHAFIGSERGKQLQSLLHRIENVLRRKVPRVGLSATLGDMHLAADFLRPGHGVGVSVIVSASAENELLILLKGYEEPLLVRPNGEEDVPAPATPGHIAVHMYKALRGSNNLVFPNSRSEVERYTNLLNSLCEQHKVPQEFWPHHGNLSKEIRAETEAALKQKEVPATAICTNTLELGIDIGAVKSVVQIGPPPSVASLRQRLGRSGRRKGEPAILRGYCIEDAIDIRSGFGPKLRLGLLQTIAMVSLLLENWFEPPVTHGAHLSTLVQQMLSAIAQNGGATIGQLYALLCAPGTPFEETTKEDFISLVRHLGTNGLLVQDSSGLLLHGPLGEKFVNHYTFYAAFASDEEFRLVAGHQTLGTLPVSQMLSIGQRILFAGKTWIVEIVDESQKVIFVKRAGGGAPPLFSGGSGRVHTKVRQRMRALLESTEKIAFIDEVAQRFLGEARFNFHDLNLKSECLIDQGHELLLVTWLGDAANEALACFMIQRGFTAAPSGPGIEVVKGNHSIDNILDALLDVALVKQPSVDELLERAQNLEREKWDWALPPDLLKKAYASLNLDIEAAKNWVASNYG